MQVSNRVGPGMSEQRRCRIRLEISREASRLFWEQGVAATSGDQIGEAVGLSTRTIWRHFRSKESCAEPIILHGVAWEMAALRRWKPELSLDDHLADEMSRHGRDADRAERADDALAMKMIALSSREPALRTACCAPAPVTGEAADPPLGSNFLLPRSTPPSVMGLFRSVG